MLTRAPIRHAHALAGGPGKVRDVVELAVLRVRQDPGGFDPARLFLDLERRQRRDLAARMAAERPGWPPRLRPADRFARFVCELAEGPGWSRP